MVTTRMMMRKVDQMKKLEVKNLKLKKRIRVLKMTKMK
jgi:hypothetical protein